MNTTDEFYSEEEKNIKKLEKLELNRTNKL